MTNFHEEVNLWSDYLVCDPSIAWSLSFPIRGVALVVLLVTKGPPVLVTGSVRHLGTPRTVYALVDKENLQ